MRHVHEGGDMGGRRTRGGSSLVTPMHRFCLWLAMLTIILDVAVLAGR